MQKGLGSRCVLHSPCLVRHGTAQACWPFKPCGGLLCWQALWACRATDLWMCRAATSSSSSAPLPAACCGAGCGQALRCSRAEVSLCVCLCAGPPHCARVCASHGRTVPWWVARVVTGVGGDTARPCALQLLRKEARGRRSTAPAVEERGWGGADFGSPSDTPSSPKKVPLSWSLETHAGYPSCRHPLC